MNKKIGLFVVLLISLSTIASVLATDDAYANRLKAKVSGKYLHITGTANDVNGASDGTINIFCDHNGVSTLLVSEPYDLGRKNNHLEANFDVNLKNSGCVKKDRVYATIEDYTSDSVIVTSKHKHRLTAEEKCLLDTTKEWKEGQCVLKEIELTDEEKCLLDFTMEWVDNECVLKEVPVCYEEVCENVKTTCNTWNYEESCESEATTCKTWNYVEECSDVWKDVWYKDHTHQLCTSHNHQNCYKESVKTTECDDVATTCNIWNYVETCEDIATTCNLWNYDSVCEQVEVSCEA